MGLTKRSSIPRRASKEFDFIERKFPASRSLRFSQLQNRGSGVGGRPEIAGVSLKELVGGERIHGAPGFRLRLGRR